MKKLMKNNIKQIIGFILGIIVSGIGVYATGLAFASGDVEHTKSNGTKTTVEAAVNELYSIHNSGNATADQILAGRTAFANGRLLTGTLPQPTTVTGNAYSGDAGFLNGTDSLTTSTSLNLANYKNNNKYDFKLGGGEQVTFPSGYYDLPINVTNGGTSGETSNSVVFAQSGLNAGQNYSTYVNSSYNPYINSDYLSYKTSSGTDDTFSYTFYVLKDCDVMIINSHYSISVSGSSTISSDPIVNNHVYTQPFLYTGHLVKGTTITISTTESYNNIQCYIILGNKAQLTQITTLGQLSGNW